MAVPTLAVPPDGDRQHASPGWPPIRPPGCSWNAPAPGPAGRCRRPAPTRWPSSAPSSTGCRWPSNWPPRTRPCSAVGEIVARLRADLRLLPARTRPRRPGTARWSRRSRPASSGSSPAARTLFERLAVCAGGFDAETARAIAGPDAPDALAALVESSLVVAAPLAAPPLPATLQPAAPPPVAPPTDEPAVPVRYRMLVPIRRHALARLARWRRRGRRPGTRAAGHCLGAGRAGRRPAARRRAGMVAAPAARGGGQPAGGDGLAGRGGRGRVRRPTPTCGSPPRWPAYCRLDGHYRDGHGLAGRRRWPGTRTRRRRCGPAPVRRRRDAGHAAAATTRPRPGTPRRRWRAYRAGGRPGGRGAGGADARLGRPRAGTVRRLEPRTSPPPRRPSPSTATSGARRRRRCCAASPPGSPATSTGPIRGCGSAGAGTNSSASRGRRRSALMNLGAVALYRGDTDRAASLLDAALRRYTVLGFPEGVGWAHNLRGLVELRGRRADRAAAHLLTQPRRAPPGRRPVAYGERAGGAGRGGPAGRRARAGRRACSARRPRIRAEIGAPVPACERPRHRRRPRRALRAELGEAAFAGGARVRPGRARWTPCSPPCPGRRATATPGPPADPLTRRRRDQRSRRAQAVTGGRFRDAGGAEPAEAGAQVDPGDLVAAGGEEDQVGAGVEQVPGQRRGDRGAQPAPPGGGQGGDAGDLGHVADPHRHAGWRRRPRRPSRPGRRPVCRPRPGPVPRRPAGVPAATRAASRAAGPVSPRPVPGAAKPTAATARLHRDVGGRSPGPPDRPAAPVRR